MTHKIYYCTLEIPELDAFLREYEELCKKHGMAFETDNYNADGGHYTTITTPENCIPRLNLDEASKGVPCIANAFARAKALKDAEWAESKRLEAIAAAEKEKALFARLKKKYEPDNVKPDHQQ